MVYSTAFLKDKDFLKLLDEERSQIHYIKIEVLDMEERPLSSIEGRCLQGSSINFDGSSSMRATCNINFVAEEGENDLTNIDNILSINKRIAVYEGIENYIDDRYPDICWFKQGVFVINQVTISHSLSSVQFSLSCKDKMCLLNGECGGGLPASITFDSYDQINEDGSVSTYKQYIFDIIFSIVHRYGNIPMDKIFISDIEKEIKQSVRFVGTGNLYFNTKTGEYRTTADDAMLADSTWVTFEYNDDVGYEYTGFTYPGELVSGIGDNVCGILDKIKTLLGNYEYFFDKDGNFHFQEIKNYLNNSYYPVKDSGESVLPEFVERVTYSNPLMASEEGKVFETNKLCVINETNYLLDVKSNSKSVYEFVKGDLLTNISATPNYANIKNDYHIWGATDKGQAIHYHLAIKKKPEYFGVYLVEPIPNSTRIKLIDKLPFSVRAYSDPTEEEERRIKKYTDEYNRYDIYANDAGYTLSFKKDASVTNIDEENNQLNLTLAENYTFSNYMNNKIIIMENTSHTDIKLFICGLEKDEYFLAITDSDLLAYFNDIEVGECKSCATFDDINALLAEKTGILSVENRTGEIGINTYALDDWSTLKEGKFYGIIDLKKPPVSIESEEYQNNVYIEPGRYTTSGLTIEGETLNIDHLATKGEEEKDKYYIPADWRAELYLQGMYKNMHDIRPDVFEQELLDLFDNIYDFQAKEFKTDLIHSPNGLLYFFDYLEPVDNLYDYSVDTIGLRTTSIQEDKIKRMYNTDIPDYIILSIDNPNREAWKQRCIKEGQQYTNVTDDVASKLGIGTIGYTAEEVARTQLYQYTNYNETIQIQAIPIYHLEPNTRITVRDSYTGIDGDYVIRSISLPLGGKGTMSISAGKALERI